LFNYITEKDFGKKPREISRIAQAFPGLAHMEFGREIKAKLEASRSIFPSAIAD
jgi:hypothetical protein